jgi:hypothetical protein
MTMTIYYITESSVGYYSFNTVQVSSEVLGTSDGSEYIPEDSEYAGIYISGSVDSYIAKLDIESYCDRMNDGSWFDTRF